MMYIHIYTYIHSGSLVNNKKEMNCDRCINMSEYQRYLGEQKQGQYKRAHTLRFCLHEVLEQARLLCRDRSHH